MPAVPQVLAISIPRLLFNVELSEVIVRGKSTDGKLEVELFINHLMMKIQSEVQDSLIDNLDGTQEVEKCCSYLCINACQGFVTW